MAPKRVKNLKVTELKRELEEMELDTCGTKSVLVQRLMQALTEEEYDQEN